MHRLQQLAVNSVAAQHLLRMHCTNPSLRGSCVCWCSCVQDWGPAFVPVGLTGGVELVGFDRATLIGALVSQQFNSSSNTFDLTVTAQFVVPAGGDNGTLSVTLATLELQKRREVRRSASKAFACAALLVDCCTLGSAALPAA
jgi:hypothetical protein